MLNNRHQPFTLILLIALLSHTALVWAEPLTPDDFAHGCNLPVTDETGLYAVELTPAVHHGLQDSDLRDIRVFNGDGLAVPHALRRLDPPQDPVRRPVPFFPLPSPSDPQSQDLSIMIQRQSNGSIIAFKTDHGQTNVGNSCSYLLDLSGFTPPPSRLELQWSTGAGASLHTVSLMESSDLAHWRPIGDRTALAELEYHGGRVSRRTIALPGQTQPYLRLDCQDGREPLRLNAVMGVQGAVSSAEQWQWAQPESVQVGEKEWQWRVEYQVQGRLRVSALDLAFPVGNSLARATIESRPSPNAPWREVGRGDFYRLDVQGTHLTSPFIRCALTTDRWWRLIIAPGDSGPIPKDQLPRLSLGWRPDELVFLGRGAGPYTLAFGSARAQENPSGQSALVFAALRQINGKSQVMHIKPGPVRPLGGEQALRPEPAPIPWRRLLLWGTLIGGVVLLAIMARSLLREMHGKGA
ncbi:DUF3999 domain-containing protein [Desulfobulbus propionicus]